MYKVIKKFVDLHDHNHVYHIGDNYPRDNASVDSERISQLKGSDNNLGIPLIESVSQKNESTNKKRRVNKE